ncbi:hypothetical protein Q604_UNBC13055G0001, partial [human gut metagenome]
FLSSINGSSGTPVAFNKSGKLLPPLALAASNTTLAHVSASLMHNDV